MKISRTTASTVAVAVVLVAVAAAGQQEAPARHPEVGGGETCVSCHQELTPEVVDEWYASRHGVNNVKCFVCHGATDESFRLHPQPERCRACHGRQVESLAAPAMEGKDCFSCHPPHLLSPHRPAGAKELGGEP